MVSAYILANSVGGLEDSLVTELREWKEIESVKMVTGPYDLIALVRVDDLDKLRDLIVKKLQRLEGIKETLTCVVVME